jgi:hypothetical protein
LAKAGARVLGAALNRLSQRGRGDYVYYDYYGAYGAEAQAKAGAMAGAKPASTAASTAPAPLADKRG